MLTTGDVAKLLKVTSQTVINWLDLGKMPYTRLGDGPRRIEEKDLLAFLTTNHAEHTISSVDLDKLRYAGLSELEENKIKYIDAVIFLKKAGLSDEEWDNLNREIDAGLN